MKKLTLFLVAMLFSTLSFAELNPFAYGLTSSLNPDQTTLTVNYSLNATAKNVDFVLLDGDKVIKTVNLNDKGLDKGSYTATVALDNPNMPLGKKLSWKIEVKGAAHNTTNNHGGYRLYHPSGVDIDNNPESPHFGRIICNEAMHKVKSQTSTYISAGFGAGIFAFDAAFDPITNGSKPGYNGGITFTNLRPDDNSSTAYAPRRVRISEDGRIFVSSLNTDGHVLWEVNPENLDDWTEVIAGTRKTGDVNSVVNGSGTYIGGPNVAFDVRGKGNDLQLVMLSGIGTFQCNEYDLGTATSWNKAPSHQILGNRYIVNYTGTSVEYDNEGGVWFCQYRGSASESQPAFLHINAKGEVDYLEALANVRAGAFRFNHDFTKVITADGRSSAGTYNQGYARIYNVKKGADGKPVLELWKTIDMSAVGHTLNDFAWDRADNVYVVGNNKEWIRAYALARTADDIATTPCASKYEFTINSAAQMAKASELNPYAYNLTSTFDNTNKVLTINYTLNANANSVDIVIKDGNLELKRIACSGKTRGSYTEVISVAGDNIPHNRKLSWSVEVKGTTKSAPTQVSTFYSLYCPHGLAIDKNPESEHFGRIIAAEGMHLSKDKTGYLSSGKGAGLYAFTPEFATDGQVHNGGLDFTRQWAEYGYQPWRVKISEDGRIFVSSCDLNGKFVWELSKDLKTWTEVLARGQEKSSATMKGNAFTTSGGQFLAGMNVSMDVIGSGKDLKLLLYSASGTGITGQTQTLFRLDEYALGEDTKWDNSKAPTQITCFNGKYGFMYSNAQVIYDGEGGYWFGASRGGNANQPNLVHFDKNGNRDYYSESDEFYGGDGVLVHNGMLFKGKKRTSTTEGNFGVYTIGKDASGNIKLTEKWAVKANHIGRNLNEFAVDFGENLYVVGNSGEKIIAFALPYSGTITTPCATQYEFTPLAGWVPSTTSDLNPFAYGLSSELIDGGKNVKINYSLNAPANSAKVVIMNGATEVKLVPCTDLTKGVHSITIPTEGLPMNTDLTWKMVVNGTSVDKVKEYATKHKLFHPSSVDIDNNPESKNFGMVLVNEAMQSVKNTTSTNPYISKGFGAGIFAFNPAFEITGKYNGNRTFSTAANMFAPRRIRISDDGRIFATAQDGSGEYLWEVNTEDLNDWTTVFQGTNDGYTLKDGSGKFVAGTNAGFDVRGEGANLQLLMLSASLPGAQVANFKCHIYNLGTASTWSTEPTKEVAGADYMLVTNQSNAQFDKDGGVWYIQYRGATTEAEPGLVHVNTSGVEDFKWLRNLTRNAGFRFNNDFTKVAIADNAFVNFYKVSKDGTGKPVLTWESGFSLATLGSNINDFAWDYANNFYAVSNSNEWAAAYRLPYDGEVTTPAASQYTFRVEYEVTIDENADNTNALTPFEGDVVTANVVRNFAPNSILTLTLPFDMSAAQISTFFGNAKVYEFATVVEDDYEIHLQFNLTSSISAGKPYILVTPTTGGYDAEDGFTIENVTINTTPTRVRVDAITMVPALDAVGTLDQNNQYYLSGGGLYNAGTYNMALVGLRAYFESTSSLPIRARVVFQDNEATSIPMVEAQSENNVRKVMKNGQLIIIRGEQKYNVQGQRME